MGGGFGCVHRLPSSTLGIGVSGQEADALRRPRLREVHFALQVVTDAHGRAGSVCPAIVPGAMEGSDMDPVPEDSHHDSSGGKVLWKGSIEARISALAEETFGSKEKAERWLLRPTGALGGQKPGELLGSAEGARQVEILLNRIAHGIAV
jgi:hypothetical protein